MAFETSSDTQMNQKKDPSHTVLYRGRLPSGYDEFLSKKLKGLVLRHCSNRTNRVPRQSFYKGVMGLDNRCHNLPVNRFHLRVAKMQNTQPTSLHSWAIIHKQFARLVCPYEDQSALISVQCTSTLTGPEV
eukprot:Blabericola_migrator_1__125@NODE_1031_length_5649_cov_78_715335_g606_i2_p2_GENE_NODE_1031_length_5649_cov_78_715335_g606_i2NODE_1031_length_5649_cov_78_715335_g606_i2_p2_ORF_typecomplete_len131_score13_08_NODE_1031_length_5649_cov_78_715335_g606_i228420